mgnify:CR=1 FL=1
MTTRTTTDAVGTALLVAARDNQSELESLLRGMGYDSIAVGCAEAFAEGMAPDDRLYLPDPVYQGGTVERTRGSDWLADRMKERGRDAVHTAERAEIGGALVTDATDGDRILVMGARDDTLIDFARELVDRVAARN